MNHGIVPNERPFCGRAVTGGLSRVTIGEQVP